MTKRNPNFRPSPDSRPDPRAVPRPTPAPVPKPVAPDPEPVARPVIPAPKTTPAPDTTPRAPAAPAVAPVAQPDVAPEIAAMPEAIRKAMTEAQQAGYGDFDQAAATLEAGYGTLTPDVVTEAAQAAPAPAPVLTDEEFLAKYHGKLNVHDSDQTLLDRYMGIPAQKIQEWEQAQQPAAQPAESAPEPAPTQVPKSDKSLAETIQITNPLLSKEADSVLANIDTPVRVAPVAQLPTARFAEAMKLARKLSSGLVGTFNRGSAGNENISSDMRVRLNETSMSVYMLYKMWQQQNSELRTILASDLTIDQNRMAEDPEYAYDMIIDYFRDNIIYGLVEKMPTVSEASQHRTRILAHDGYTTKLHPLAFLVWNADFDGDAMKVSFDPEAVRGAKGAIDFWVGIEGEGKVPVDFFNMVPWVDGIQSTRDFLEKMFVTETPSPIDMTPDQLDKLAQAVADGGNIDKDIREAGFRDMLRIVRKIGDRQPDKFTQELASTRLLEEVYQLNQDIRFTQLEQAAGFDPDVSIGGVEVLFGDKKKKNFTWLTSKWGLPSSLMGMWRAEGNPLSSPEGANVNYRTGSSKAKSGRKLNELTLSEARDAEAEYTLLMNGIESLDEKVRRVTDRARQRIYDSVGFPAEYGDITDPAVMKEWLYRFIYAYNREAYIANNAAGMIMLDSSLNDYGAFEAKYITWPSKNPEDNVRSRGELRTQFALIYGSVSMKALFGSITEIQGYEDMSLEDFIHDNTIKVGLLGSPATQIRRVGEFVHRLADMRTSFARKFNDSLMGEDAANQYGKTRKRGVLEKLIVEFEHKDGTKERMSYLKAAVTRMQEGMPVIRPDYKNHAMKYKMPPGSLNPELEAKHPEGTTTLALSASGERTATTRSSFLGKIGELITFEGRPEVYEIVDRRTLGTMDEAEIAKWEELEGWNYEYVVKNLPKLGKYQTVYRLADISKLAETRPIPAHALDQDLSYLARVMYLLSPDIFFFLGLDNPNAFVTTQLGLKFYNAISVDQLGGVLYEAVARYRFTPIQKQREAVAEARAAIERGEDMTAELVAAQHAYEYELDQLASSSATWAAIVFFYRNGRPEIFENVLFADIGKAEKDRILASFVNNPLVPGGGRKYETWEIAASLFSNPTGPYTRNRFMTDYGHKDMFDNVTAANNAIDGFAKANHLSYTKQVRKAREIFGEESRNAGRIFEFLEQIAKNPRDLVQFEPWMVVDAILSAMEKTGKSSEKSTQELVVSYIYSAVSELFNSGTWSDMTYGTDFLLGEISQERFWRTPGLLARVLSDPEFSIIVYDEAGAKAVIDREALIGKRDVSEVELWNWLEANPRVAMALRMRAPSQSVSKKTGMSPTVATSSLVGSMIELDKIRSKSDQSLKVLADKPGFYAMVSLAILMTGKTRAQARTPGIVAVDQVIGFLRRLDPDQDMTAFVDEILAASDIKYADVTRIKELYDLGTEQEVPSNPLQDADLAEDVRDMWEYQLGQLRAQLAEDLKSYARLLEDQGLGDIVGKEATSAEGAELFHFGDEESTRSYFDQVQVLSGAKTMASTNVNGGISRLLAPLLFVANLVRPPCDAEGPQGMIREMFEEVWEDYEGRNVLLTNDKGLEKWVPINIATIEEILDATPEGEAVFIEDPAACTDTLCPCKRHATADRSTNFYGRQTQALGRVLTIVRMLSTEGLNLKVKTKGDDGRDSIKKMDVYELMKGDARLNIEFAFHDNANDVIGARMVLAKAMQAAFNDLGYQEELVLDDFINVAQILINVVEGEDGVKNIDIMSMGRLSALVGNAITQERNDNPDGLTHDQAEAAAVKALLDPESYRAQLDVARLRGGFKAGAQVRMAPSIASQRDTSIGRNMAKTRKIVNANEGLEILTDQQLDSVEYKIKDRHMSEVSSWEGLIGHITEDAPAYIGPRVSYRVIGYFDKDGNVDKDSDGNDLAKAAVGARNAWVIEAGRPDAAEKIVTAYELGMTLFIDGDLDPDVWDVVASKIEDMGPHQLLPIGELDKNIPFEERPRYMLPMMSIQMNGGNTSPRNGAYDMGEWQDDPRYVYTIIETPFNEHSLGDAEVGAYEHFVNNIKVNRTGEYRLRLKSAFAGFAWSLGKEGITRLPKIEFATVKDIQRYIIRPYLADTDLRAPIEFDEKIPVDLGVELREGSKEWWRFTQGMLGYLGRIESADPKTSFLPDCKPDDIVGWLKATSDDGTVRFHPVRLYELGNASGAPDSMKIDQAKLKAVGIDHRTEELVISWSHVGTMLGRAFKLFEGGFAANKSMARPEALPDVSLRNGMKPSAQIAKQSTASRRTYLRRQQKLSTLMYVARMAPYGYNLAELKDALPDHPDLKKALRSSKATHQMWRDALADGPIRFFKDNETMDLFCTKLANKALDYGINPTNVFASRFGMRKTPSNIWFNFQVLFERGPAFQGYMMELMSLMNKELCPPGLEDTGNTFFNHNLQVLFPITHTDRYGRTQTKEVWVDMYAGFHFFDDHYSGHSNSGATVRTHSLPALNVVGLGGKRLSGREMDAYLGWANMGDVDRSALAGVMEFIDDEFDDDDGS